MPRPLTPTSPPPFLSLPPSALCPRRIISYGAERFRLLRVGTQRVQMHRWRCLGRWFCSSRRSRQTIGMTISRKESRYRSCKVRAYIFPCCIFFRPNLNDIAFSAVALEKASAEDLTQNSSGSSERNENDSETIRPLATRSPGGSLRDPHQAPVPVAKPPPGAIAPIVEDYSDLAVDEDDEWQEKFSDFKMKNSVRKGLFHPDDLKTLGLGGLTTSPGPKTAPLPDMSGVGDGVKRSFSSGSGSASGSGSRG